MLHHAKSFGHIFSDHRKMGLADIVLKDTMTSTFLIMINERSHKDNTFELHHNAKSDKGKLSLIKRKNQ